MRKAGVRTKTEKGEEGDAETKVSLSSVAGELNYEL